MTTLAAPATLCPCCKGSGVIGRAYPPAYGYRSLPTTRGWRRMNPTQCYICAGSGVRVTTDPNAETKARATRAHFHGHPAS